MEVEEGGGGGRWGQGGGGGGVGEGAGVEMCVSAHVLRWSWCRACLSTDSTVHAVGTPCRFMEDPDLPPLLLTQEYLTGVRWVLF